MDTEKINKTLLFSRALARMSHRSKRWESNFNRYQRWPDETRLWWVNYIEAQAKNGLPMAVELINEVIKLRMKS